MSPRETAASGLMPSLVVLVGIVAFGLGGYEPWSVFVLEAGAAVFALGLVTVRFGSSRRLGGEGEMDERVRHAAWRRLPLLVRHPGLGRLLRFLSFGLVRAPATNDDVELLLPTREGGSVTLDPSREAFFLGVPFRRSGLFWPLVLMTLWIGASLVPVSRGLLARISPTAHRVRLESASLLGSGQDSSASPTSLVPFLTARDLWIWIAVVALFAVTFSLLQADRRHASRLGFAVLALGVVSGLYGVWGWFDAVTEAFGLASSSIRARGSFGNANHYAMFQGITVLVGLGCLSAALRRRSGSRSRPRSLFGDRSADAGGRAAVVAVGVVVAGLGLVLSLSRSGIAFTLVAATVFLLLVSSSSPSPSGRRASVTPYAATGLALLALLVWLGIEPLVARFGDLAEELDREGTRWEVWRDSAKAVGDFWLTGSGLASFRYVATFYRTFPGNIFYSWAHNDYLQLAIELGLTGVFLLIAILASGFRAVRRARLALEADPAGAALHAGFMSALVLVACHSATDFGLHLPANFALLALVAAAAVGMAGSSAPATATATAAAERRSSRGRSSG